MPTLHWIGKEKVVNHHRDVPYRVLEKEYEYNLSDNQTTSENKIIHGDNLEALKSLLPEYEGRVNCIYIDPPYNTGNESWVYNDNVNHPKIKKWLGDIVGKEGEDLTRHDKWLCMMYPRLKLLHKLLAKDGAIFISIDDNEQANLKLICDEIFGINNFVTDLIWRSSDASNNDSKQFSIDYNHTLIYSKNSDWTPNKFDRGEEHNQHYKNPDNDPKGPWFSGNLSSPNPRPNLTYDIISPNGIIIYPPKNGWRWKKDRVLEFIESGEIVFSDDQKRIIKKTYLFDQSGITPSNIWWDIEETGHNRNAKYELIKVFNELKTSDIFKTPKPTKFISRILQLATSKTSIILDSFAGSGTTGHAVLNLNKADGGNRKFILIEMEDYASTITAERVKRVIDGYGEGSKAVPGTGGNFAYYKLGAALFEEENNLNEAVSLSDIRNYIWYSETRTPFQEPETKDSSYFLGSMEDTAYYFVYEQESLTTLDFELLSSHITNPASQYIIYADNCLLPAHLMEKHRIIFKKIPRDITRF